MREGMRVGELAGQAGVSAPTVRFYEREGLLTPPRRSEAGYRLYPVEALAELRFITRAKTLGLSLDQIRVLRSQPDAEAERRQMRHLIAHQLVRTRQQIAELQAMAGVLAGLFGTLAEPRAGSPRGRGGGEGGPAGGRQPGAVAGELLAAAALSDETARIEAAECRCTCALDPGCTCGCPCCAPAGTAAPGRTGAAPPMGSTGRSEEH